MEYVGQYAGPLANAEVIVGRQPFFAFAHIILVFKDEFVLSGGCMRIQIVRGTVLSVLLSMLVAGNNGAVAKGGGHCGGHSGGHAAGAASGSSGGNGSGVHGASNSAGGAGTTSNGQSSSSSAGSSSSSGMHPLSQSGSLNQSRTSVHGAHGQYDSSSSDGNGQDNGQQHYVPPPPPPDALHNDDDSSDSAQPDQQKPQHQLVQYKDAEGKTRFKFVSLTH